MIKEIFEYDGEGIKCVYDNKKWVVCIKNWKPNNDIDLIKYLEVHHETDEQFILLQGKAILLLAKRINNKFQIEVVPMEENKVYNVPTGVWFNTITQKNTKLIYIQDAGTTSQNSEYCDMTIEELEFIKNKSLSYFNL